MSGLTSVPGDHLLKTDCRRLAFADERQLLFIADFGGLRLREAGPLRKPTVDTAEARTPVTKPEECKGTRRRPLIACLQVDRRVEVEVTGTC